MMRVQTLALLSVVGFAAAANPQACVAATVKFDTSVDYFPQKTVADQSNQWSVSYGKVYKNVTVTSEGQTYLYQLVQCFADASNNTAVLATVPACSPTADPPCSRINVPITSVAITGNLFLGMIEEIEEEQSVSYTETAVVSPCVQSNNPGEANATDETQLGGVSVFFTETASEIPAADSAYYSKFVKIAIAEETLPIARAEWVEFASLFYNKEDLANYVVARVEESYDVQSQTSSQMASRNILWIKSFSSMVVTMATDSYLQQIATDASLSIIGFNGSAVFGANFTTMLQSAVAIIIDGYALDTTSALSQLQISSATTFPFYRNGTLHIYQPNRFITDSDTVTNSMAYFDEQMSAAPDLLLSDVIKATRDSLQPWSDAEFMYLRRVDELRTRIEANSSSCELGVSRPTDPSSIRSLVISGLVTVVDGNPTGNITYANMTDYFPDKFVPRYAENFEIAYHLTWKLVRNRLAGEIYVLIQRGTPESAQPNSYIGNKRFYVPVQSISIQSTPEVAIVSLLGVVDKIYATTTAPDPCVIKGLADEMYLSYSYDAPCSSAAITGAEVDYSSKKCSNSVYSSATSDPGPLNRVEWVGYHGAFHNKEARAIEIMAEIAPKYYCVADVGRQAAAISGKRPSIAVMSTNYFSGTGYMANRAAYERQLFYAAGGINAAFDTNHSMMTNATSIASNHIAYANTTVLKAALRDLDVFIDNLSYNPIYPNWSMWLAAYGLDEVADADLPIIKNKMVFRIDKRVDTEGSLFSQQFTRYVTEPDAAVQDYTFVIHNGATNSTGTYFLRNLYTNETRVEINGDNCSISEATALLTTATDICSLPCEIRTTEEYCTQGCYWWLDATCNSVAQVIPTDDLNNSVGAIVPSLLVLITFLAVLF